MGVMEAEVRKTVIPVRVIAALLILFPLFSGVSYAKHTASRIVYGPKYLYVTVKGQRFFYIIDRDNNRLLKKVPVKSPPCGGFISENGMRFYIALGELDQIAVVDTETNSIVEEINLNAPGGDYLDPGGMALSPDGRSIYVANESGDSLSVVDMTTRLVRSKIPVGYGPQDVALTPDGRFAYMTDFYGVWVLDTKDRRPLQKIAFRDPSTDADRTDVRKDGEIVYRGPRDIVMSPDGETAYVALEDSGEVAVLDTRVNRVAATVPVGRYPGGLALSPDGKRLFFAHRDSDHISVLDTEKQSVVRTVRVGRDPWDVTLSPDGSTAYVVNQADATVSVIELETFKVQSTIVLGVNGSAETGGETE